VVSLANRWGWEMVQRNHEAGAEKKNEEGENRGELQRALMDYQFESRQNPVGLLGY